MHVYIYRVGWLEVECKGGGNGRVVAWGDVIGCD